jgi:hypothetical protein
VNAFEVFKSSDGELTKRYYAKLEACGPIGVVAVNLFRAQKCSTRAKAYRGGLRGVGSFRSMAYERKAWAMQNLCRVLVKHGGELGIPFGWKRDANTPLRGDASWILYIDLPQGQVSFHSPARYEGPEYPGDWDKVHANCERVLVFCGSVFATQPQAMNLFLFPEEARA